MNLSRNIVNQYRLPLKTYVVRISEFDFRATVLKYPESMNKTSPPLIGF